MKFALEHAPQKSTEVRFLNPLLKSDGGEEEAEGDDENKKDAAAFLKQLNPESLVVARAPTAIHSFAVRFRVGSRLNFRCSVCAEGGLGYAYSAFLASSSYRE